MTLITAKEWYETNLSRSAGLNAAGMYPLQRIFLANIEGENLSFTGCARVAVFGTEDSPEISLAWNELIFLFLYRDRSSGSVSGLSSRAVTSPVAGSSRALPMTFLHLKQTRRCFPGTRGFPTMNCPWWEHSWSSALESNEALAGG